MRDLLHRLPHKNTIFAILNVAFWLGLLAFLSAESYRLLVAGVLLALALGGYMLYAALSPRITRGMAHPGLARSLAAVLGLAATLFGLWMGARILDGTVPTPREARRQALERRLAAAATSTRLDLSGLDLRHIPPEVWQMGHLVRLDLNNNRLESLPPEICRLEKLEWLDLWHNRLQAVPPEIGSLSHLEWLDLSTNRLETLPPEFARLRQLTHLQLDHNRFTTLPHVILELPNLELLFLSGNRLGPLPDALTRRAEAGELDLSYRPGASRHDWASVLVIGLLFALPLALSLGAGWLWTARERAHLQEAQKEGPAFRIPPFLRQPTLFVLFASLALSLFIFLCALNGAQTGITMQAGLGIPLIFLPLALGALLFLLHHTGLVVLAAGGVSLRCPGRHRFLPYDEIVELKSQARIFAPGLLIRGRQRTLRIPRTLHDLPRLYQLLLQRVPPAVRDAALAGTAPPPPGAAPLAAGATPRNGPVVTLAVPRRVWLLYAAGTGLLVLIYLGIGLLGLWMGLARGEIPPFTGLWLRNAAIFFLLVSLLFVPAIVFVVRSLFTPYGPYKIERPVAWELYPDRLRYRFPRGPWHGRPAGALLSATLKPMSMKARARVDRVLVQQPITVYLLLLEFAGGRQLCVDQERAYQFGETPERLHAILQHLYLDEN